MKKEVKVRRNAWTPQEDNVFVQILLRCMREGKSQQEAFEKISWRTGRTEAACAFRWNNDLRALPDVTPEFLRARKQGQFAVGRIKSVGVTTASPYSTKKKAYLNKEHVSTDLVGREAIAAAFVESDYKPDTRYNEPKEEPKAIESAIDKEIQKNPIYSSVLDLMIKSQRKQVAYGLDKYVESLNINSWSTVETLDHIISETVDQLHYMTMFKLKVLKALEKEE